jgi:hypothetical protein
MAVLSFGASMKWMLGAAAALLMLPLWTRTDARPMLYDAVALNIGVNCQWQTRCMAQQRTAMKRSLNYVSATRPPHWRVQMCNKNAGRGGYRTDWIGFDHCIRNEQLRPSRDKRYKR